MRPHFPTLYFPVVAGFLLLAASFAAADEAEVGRNCENPLNQLEINRCARMQADKAEHAMNALYDLKISKLTDPSRERLHAAQEAWRSYRKKSCVYQAAGWEGGSGWAMVYHTCMADMAENRSRELEAYLACTENGCPD